MKRNIFFVLAFISILSVGCGSKDRGNTKVREISIPFDLGRNTIKCSDVFSTLQIVQLQSDTTCLLDEIMKVKTFHDTLFISDGVSIKLFRVKDGSFIGNIKSKGRSPEEYSFISDFDIDTTKRQIFILDRGAQAVKHYNFCGKYLQQVKLGYWAMAIIVNSGDDFILYNGNTISESSSSRITTYKAGKQFGKFSPMDEYKNKYLNIVCKTNFSKYRDDVLFTEPFNDTVYKVKTSSLEPRYVFNTGSNKIPTEFFQKNYYDIAEFFSALNKTTYAYGILNYVETDSTIFFKYRKEGKAKYFKITKGNFEVTQFTSLLEDINLNGVELDIDGVDMYDNGGGVAIYSIPAFKFIEYIEKSGRLTSAPKLSPGVHAIANSIKANDNPIIYIAKVK